MQIPPLRPGASALERHVPGVAVADVARPPGDIARLDEVGVARDTAVTTTAQLTSRDGELNRSVAGAQQALDFLDALASRLHAVKGELSRALSRSEPAAGPALDALGEFVRQRNAMTSGSLDGHLRLVAPGEARQGFAVRGLDRAALVSGTRETLTFAVGGRRDLPVVIDPELPPQAMIRRLDAALTPVGVRVASDAAGEPKFSARETDWPQLRDGFAVRGEGRRFPAGEFNRVALDADPDAIRVPTPVRAFEDLRAALHEVVNALDVVQRARAVVAHAIASARARFDDPHIAVETLWAAEFVREFGTLAQRSGYGIFAAIGPALAAVSRPRVVALLRLD
ncbi:hypothetical protein [Aromatoleum sp.]|uniref:hypothetical protein n=1 Tax=Aromatoleum sp. TaxID=2307007 RepID=UPI002FC9BB75